MNDSGRHLNSIFDGNLNIQRTSDIYSATRLLNLYNASRKGHYLPSITAANFPDNNTAVTLISKIVHMIKKGVPPIIAFGLAGYGSPALALTDDTIAEGGNIVLNPGDYIPMLNTSDTTAEKAITASSPPSPTDYFSIFGNILNETDWEDGSITDADISLFFYNQSTGNIVSSIRADARDINGDPQYIVQGINKKIVFEGDKASVKFNGTQGKIEDENTWTVMYPTGSNGLVQANITYIPPDLTPPNIVELLHDLERNETGTKNKIIVDLATDEDTNTTAYRLENGNLQKVYSNETFSLEKTFELLAENGDNNFSINVTDPSGNTARKWLNMTIDLNPAELNGFNMSLFASDADSKENDIELEVKRNRQTIYNIYINGDKVLTNSTFSDETITEIYKNASDGENTIKIEATTENGVKSSVSGTVVIDTTPPAIITKSVNLLDNRDVSFLINVNENANWTIKRDGLKIGNNKTKNIDDIWQIIYKDVGNKDEGTYRYTLDLKDDKGNINNSIGLGNITIKNDDDDNKKSGGGSSGGGGGGGSSGEEFLNIKYNSVVRNIHWKIGDDTTYYFKQGPIAELHLTAEKSFKDIVGKTEILHHNSSMIPWKIYEQLKNEVEDDGGEILFDTNLWIGNYGTFTGKNVDNAELTLKLKDTVISEKDVQRGLLEIYRYDPETEKMIRLDYDLPTEQKYRNNISVSVKLPEDNENIGGNIIIAKKTGTYKKSDTVFSPEPTNTNPAPESTQVQVNESAETTEKKAHTTVPGFGVLAAAVAISAAQRLKRNKGKK